ATEHFAIAQSPADEVSAGSDDGTYWGAQALGQTKGTTIKILRELWGWEAAGHAGVEQARTIEGHGDPLLACHSADLLDGRQGIDVAATTIVRVFQTYQARRGIVDTVPVTDGAGHLCRTDHAALAVNQVHLHTGQGGESA